MNHPDSPDPTPSDPDVAAMPSFQPPGAPQQPSAGAPSRAHEQQSDHSAPYGQTPPLYGGHTPYGQAPSPYGAIPPMSAPKRPAAATAAAVLGIISGSLGVFLALGGLSSTLTDRSSSSDPIAAATSWFLCLTIIATVTGLLVCGIRFLSGKCYKLLLSSVIAQTVMTALIAAVLLIGAQFFASTRSSSVSSSTATGMVVIAVFYGLVGLGLSISNLILLLSPTTRQWTKQVS